MSGCSIPPPCPSPIPPSTPYTPFCPRSSFLPYSSLHTVSCTHCNYHNGVTKPSLTTKRRSDTCRIAQFRPLAPRPYPPPPLTHPFVLVPRSSHIRHYTLCRVHTVTFRSRRQGRLHPNDEHRVQRRGRPVRDWHLLDLGQHPMHHLRRARVWGDGGSRDRLH